MNYLNRKISGYNRVDDLKGGIITVGTFLKSTKNIDSIELIRSEKDEKKQSELKKELLPCATISGIFEPIRSDENLKEHSGLICIDIDDKDNPSFIGHWESVKEEIGHIQEVLYCGISVRGNGLFVVIPISDPSKHREHFKALDRVFKSYGINVDKSCINESRLRYVSYDPKPYINENAKVYTKTYTEPKQVYKPASTPTYDNDDLLPLDICVEKCERSHIDVTGTEIEWFQVGSALSNGLGESGRSYFHRLSSLYPSYKHTETERKYDYCLRHGKTAFEWLFTHFGDYGITYADEVKERRRSEQGQPVQPLSVLTQKEKDLQTMERLNPALTELINTFDLVLNAT